MGWENTIVKLSVKSANTGKNSAGGSVHKVKQNKYKAKQIKKGNREEEAELFRQLFASRRRGLQSSLLEPAWKQRKIKFR